MIKDREGNVVSADEKQEGFLSFLYNNGFGKLLLKLLCRPFISNIGKLYMESSLSKGRIQKLIKQHNIDMNDYEQRDFPSFNEFFIRKICDGKRVIDFSDNSIISPADSKLTVYDINEDSSYTIKGCNYSIKNLLMDDSLAEEFLGGKCFVYRLTVDNYHRYCYPDNGRELSHKFISGDLHTVNPIALEKYDVYGKNCRELTVLDTENFGKVAFVEVGAMMVGKINNYHNESFKRGEEKGYFSFGGSTIVVLYKKDMVRLDADITENSAQEIETTVLYGERVGERL